MHRQFAAIKPLLTACGLLLTTAAGTELALRLWEPGNRIAAESTDGLREPCAITHHRLPRLRTVATLDPDSGDSIELSINSHGLRGPEVSVPKPPGVYRILCLGDETVLGPHVAASKTFPAHLQRRLQFRTRLRVEVLNSGVPGDCPLLTWLRLRDSLLGLQPDLIVLHVDMTDIADDRLYRRRTRLDATGSPIACLHPALASAAQRPWWRDLCLTDFLARQLGAASGDPAKSDGDPRAATAWLRENPTDWRLYVEQALSPTERIRNAAEAASAVFLLSTSPQPWQVSGEASAGPGVREACGVAPGTVFTSHAPFEAVAAFAESQGIPYCDASSAFRESADPARLYFRNVPRLSPDGNRLYAQVLGDFIAARSTIFSGLRGASPIDPATSPTATTPGREPTARR